MGNFAEHSPIFFVPRPMDTCNIKTPMDALSAFKEIVRSFLKDNYREIHLRIDRIFYNARQEVMGKPRTNNQAGNDGIWCPKMDFGNNFIRIYY